MTISDADERLLWNNADDRLGPVAVVRIFAKRPLNTRKLKDRFGGEAAGGYAPLPVFQFSLQRSFVVAL